MENVKEIPTAEHLYDYTFDGLNIEDNEHLIPEIMIEFAKLHVKEALKQASEKASFDGIDGVNYSSVLTSYPLEKIK